MGVLSQNNQFLPLNIMSDLSSIPSGLGSVFFRAEDRKWGQKMTWDCKFWEEVELLPRCLWCLGWGILWQCVVLQFSGLNMSKKIPCTTMNRCRKMLKMKSFNKQQELFSMHSTPEKASDTTDFLKRQT